ncbi:TolC family protein [Pedobacter sp. AW31-3R]|uniref:TolC family protein n=1 Tax=Pedobacter sp. AW31-3R TaxID=3445781 RepID=UPI003FA131EB
MKQFSALTLLIVAFFSLELRAQETIIEDINYATLEKYIAAAKDYYPRRKLLNTKAEGIKTTIPMSTLSYLDIFNVSYFYRPDKSSDAINPSNPYTVNGFQFGVNLNLGTFLQKPYATKRAKAEYKVAKLEAEEYDNTLVLEVKRRYYAYIQQIGQLKINTQSVQDNKNVADNLKYKFEKGELGLDVYNQSRINLATANTSKLQSEVSFLEAKDALEEIIGCPLSDIK